jgi:hypothetical protein
LTIEKPADTLIPSDDEQKGVVMDWAVHSFEEEGWVGPHFMDFESFEAMFDFMTDNFGERHKFFLKCQSTGKEALLERNKFGISVLWRTPDTIEEATLPIAHQV